MRRTERAAYRTKFYSNLSSPTRFDEEPKYITSVMFIFWDLFMDINVFMKAES